MSTLFGIPGVSSSIGVQSVPGGSLTGATPVGGDRLKLSRTDPLHFASGGGTPGLGDVKPASFENAMLKAMDGVNAAQVDSSNAMQAMLTDPDSIDAHDVTIAMAKANMSLDITRTILTRVVTAWKDIINTR
ncbi:MAG: flagellar hook-basal body complex protein FliE [Spirochaetae bacterium HGW-Spirochaetae-7]|jgi:flagellar hook-basal body complex protein FliE|nr:MAG: flagellar hook-basal body complex protein FliE [Spirochaetae bacterium HGW-Spirochaetae-7]